MVAGCGYGKSIISFPGARELGWELAQSEALAVG